jgi:hypothetical protein
MSMELAFRRLAGKDTSGCVRSVSSGQSLPSAVAPGRVRTSRQLHFGMLKQLSSAKVN